MWHFFVNQWELQTCFKVHVWGKKGKLCEIKIFSCGNFNTKVDKMFHFFIFWISLWLAKRYIYCNYWSSEYDGDGGEGNLLNHSYMRTLASLCDLPLPTHLPCFLSSRILFTLSSQLYMYLYTQLYIQTLLVNVQAK